MGSYAAVSPALSWLFHSLLPSAPLSRQTLPCGITSLQEEATVWEVALKAWAHLQFLVNYSGFCLPPPPFPRPTSPLLGVIYLAPAPTVRRGSHVTCRHPSPHNLEGQTVSQDFGALRPGPSNLQRTPPFSGTLQTVT